MSLPRAEGHLASIRDAITQIDSYVRGMDREGFLSDPILQDAVALRLIVIGEAAARLLALYPELLDVAPAIPWKQMRGLRNRLVHVYASIDHEVVWETTQQFLPQLARDLTDLDSTRLC